MFQFDEAFVKQLKLKDATAYNEFYLRTVDILFRYAHSRYFLTKAETEDLLSEFYLKFWRVIVKYDDKYKFETFVRTVFKNMLKDYFKKSKQYHMSEEIISRETDDSEDALIDVMERSYQIEQIEEAMHGLDAVCGEIIFLKYIEGRSSEEMSRLLGISQEAVRQRVSRALRRLKELLED